MRYDDYWKDIISGKNNSFLGHFISFLLYLLSFIYRVIWEAYLFLYKLGILRRKKIKAKVISFGNLTLGGTGKTQFVIKFLNDISKDKKVAVLLRGYKSKTKKDISVISDGKGNILPPKYSDEGHLIADKSKHSVVIVGKKRVKAAKVVMENFNCETIVLDDGYQYLKLEKDIEILLIDASISLKNYKIFPRGILREDFKNISRADIIIITKINFANDILKLKNAILNIKPGIPIMETKYKILHLKEIFSNKIERVDMVKNKRVVIVSGIANPEVFEEEIKKINPLSFRSYRFSDHHFYTENDFKNILSNIKEREEIIITTEKDAVKMKEIKIGIPVYSTVLDIEIMKGEEIWKKIIG